MPRELVSLVVDDRLDEPSVERPWGGAASLVVILTMGASIPCPDSDLGRRVQRETFGGRSLKTTLGLRSATNIYRSSSLTYPVYYLGVDASYVVRLPVRK